MDTSPQPVLKISGLGASYGQVRILSGIDLELQPGQSLAILGANGSGKTTLLRSISAIMVKRSGSVLFEGREIAQSSPHAIVRLGLSHVPEGKHLFKPLTVRQNLEIGSLPLRMAGRNAEVDQASALVYRLFPRLLERLDQSAQTLSGGEQQMLAIGRALMSRPKVLLLDEPSVGLAPKVNELLFAALASLKALGVTIIVAEQLVQLACAFADDAVVMHLGKIAMRGKATEVRDDPQIRELYLGT